MDQPFLCTICGRSFTMKEELIHHVLLQHDGSNTQNSQENAANPNVTEHLNGSAQVVVKNEPVENRKSELFPTKTDKISSEVVLKLQTSRQVTNRLLSLKLPTTDNRRSVNANHSRPLEVNKESRFKRWHDMKYSLSKKHPFSKETKQTSPDSRALVCGMCNKTFRNQAEQHIHIFTHVDEDWFKCDKCGKAFSGKYYLCKHKKSCDAKFFTDIMAKQLKENAEGKNMKIVSEDKNIDDSYVCQICEDTYVTLAELKEHKKTHTEERMNPNRDYENVSLPKGCSQKIIGALSEKISSKQITLNHPIKLKCRNTSESALSEKKGRPQAKSSFVCNICQERFEAKDKLASHKEIHTYHCNMCGVTCEGERALSDHVQTHVKGQLFHCDLCGIVFGEENHFQGHECLEDKENTQITDVYKTDSERSITKVLISKQEKKTRRLGCMVCNKLFLTRQQLTNHVRTHTGEKPFECEYCGRGFTHDSNRRRHRRLHTGERPYRCDICGQAFLQATTLKYHRMVHTNENPFKCDLCDRGFKRASLMRKHKLRHFKPNFYAKFDTKYKILKEVTTHNTLQNEQSYQKQNPMQSIVRKDQAREKPRPHTCDVCGKGFPRKPELTRHYRTHTGEKPFKCHLCGNAYVEKYSLTRHLRRHADGTLSESMGSQALKRRVEGMLNKVQRLHGEGMASQEKPHVNRFQTKEVFELHENNPVGKSKMRNVIQDVHIESSMPEAIQISSKSCKSEYSHKVLKSTRRDITPRYHCDMCSRIYATKELLDNHKTSHECEFCGKQFRHKSIRDKHLIIHSMKKDHRCDECGKSFHWGAALRRHMTVHTDERRYPCDVCGFAFKEKVHLQRHLRIHARRGEKKV